MIRRTACIIARGTDPYRNLAIEKQLLDTLPEETAILYLWQNAHTIVCGRNQNPWYECRVKDFMADGGRIAKRLSGGGTVYHDMGNLNFTFLVPRSSFDIPKQLSVIQAAVASFGLRAVRSGRNDLEIGGRKFSGNAFYTSGQNAYHHGTLLVNADKDIMARYLLADQTKLQNRGVKSVPARVINLQSLSSDITVESLQSALFRAFAKVYVQKPTLLDEKMMDQPTLEKLTEQYRNPAWIFPREVPYTFTVKERFPWGGITVNLLVEDGMIREAKFFTDAMDAGLFSVLEQSLIGSPSLVSSITGRLKQKQDMIRDESLKQVVSDIGSLICSHIRANDRSAYQQPSEDSEPASHTRSARSRRSR
ncbi:MAG TPA: lipoate--protein ligase [Candidatus Limiplasma sp.]|nr:lipoate--protein ligase [Candidatus Limiplasma sp.]